MKRSLLVIALALFSFTACDKDENEAYAYVINLGPEALDGCGWVLRIDNVDYSPVNLSTEFQQDSLYVEVEYDLLESKHVCGLQATEIPEIEIEEIEVE